MSKPFSDIKFCSTSVPSDIRSEISTKIKAMGGTHSSNLMSDVDILIVGDRNTEKFKFSVQKRFDIKFIKPEVILKIHSIWLNNEDSNDQSLIKVDNYLLPVFENFNVCLSRISNDQHITQNEKKLLLQYIKENGGIVSDSLTTTSSCLITNEKSGKRYEMSKKWQIPIIHPLWILDSIKRKAALDFQYYNIEIINDINRIGEGSCLVWNELKNRKKRKILIDDQINEVSNNVLQPIKLKDSKKIWNSIMQNPSKDSNHSKSSKNESSWDDNVDDDSNDNNLKQQFESDNSNLNKKKQQSPIVTSKLFENQTFRIELFDHHKKSTLIKVIKSHSGQIVENDPNFIIIPSNFPQLDIPSDLYLNSSEIMTEWFIERCLHYSCLKIDDWGKPFYNKILNVPDLNISITGFEGIELLHITKMIQLLGFKFHEALNSDRDLLILNINILNIDKKTQLFQKFPSLFNPVDPSLKNSNSINSTKKKIKFSKQKCIPIISTTYLFTVFKDSRITNINQRDFCIYCPRVANLKPALITLVESDPKDITLDNDKTNTDIKNNELQYKDNDNHTSLPKLPSPIRNKRRDNWGRLVGRASKSQLNSTEMDQPINDLDGQQKNGELDSTQISYGQSETNIKLLKLLNKDNEEVGNRSTNIKKKNNDIVEKRSKRTTRAGFKEMQDVLDDD